MHMMRMVFGLARCDLRGGVLFEATLRREKIDHWVSDQSDRPGPRETAWPARDQPASDDQIYQDGLLTAHRTVRTLFRRFSISWEDERQRCASIEPLDP